MLPKIETLSEKKLIGQRVQMSLANNRTGELWKNFMQQRKAITNKVNNDLISMQVYSPTHFANFKHTNEFEKWAAVEVSGFESLQSGLEAFTLKSGLYAVFDYKGSSTDDSIFRHIFTTWLPSSNYMLDNRPHFEILGDKYKNNDVESEEEIWIPVKLKS
jgi:AraC family transcriptional regulator